MVGASGREQWGGSKAVWWKSLGKSVLVPWMGLWSLFSAMTDGVRKKFEDVICEF